MIRIIAEEPHFPGYINGWAGDISPDMQKQRTRKTALPAVILYSGLQISWKALLRSALRQDP